jgi:hypothetical protein
MMNEVRIELGNGVSATIEVADKSIFDEYRHKDGKIYGKVEVTSERKGLFLVCPVPRKVIITGKVAK